MVFQIRDNDRNTLFDIEVFVKESESDKTNKLYYSKIITKSCSDGIAKYVFNNIKDKTALDKFINESDVIFDFNFWLWEKQRVEPMPEKEAYKYHNDVVVPHIKEVLKGFCSKFDDLWTNED